MKPRIPTFVLLWVTALSGCMGSPIANREFGVAYASAASLCEVLVHSDEYVGRRVKVRGQYAFTPHQRVLRDSACPSREVAVEVTASPESLERDRQVSRLLSVTGSRGVMAVYSGVLSVRPVVVVGSEPRAVAYSLVDATLDSAEWHLKRE